MSGHGARIKAAWLLVVPYLVFARPTPRALTVGAAVVALGLTLRAWAAGTIDKEASLATSGPYAFVRNPLYLGSLLIGTGFGLAGGHWAWPVGFVLFFVVAYGGTIRREGERLGERFGARYVEYETHVPAFLPRLVPWRGTASSASGESGFRWSRWKRNREWEALLGAGAALALLALKVWVGGG